MTDAARALIGWSTIDYCPAPRHPVGEAPPAVASTRQGASIQAGQPDRTAHLGTALRSGSRGLLLSCYAAMIAAPAMEHKRYRKALRGTFMAHSLQAIACISA